MKNEYVNNLYSETGYELANKSEEPFMRFLHKTIHVEAKILVVFLAAFMITVIVSIGGQ